MKTKFCLYQVNTKSDREKQENDHNFGEGEAKSGCEIDLKVQFFQFCCQFLG